MDIEQYWNKALKNTEIIRSRMKSLSTTQDTRVPYILLSESTINHGDTVVRKGEVLVQKPAIMLPPDNPQFSGFDFESDNGVDPNSLVNFLIVRGVSLPSLKYDNQINTLDIYEGRLSQAIKDYSQELQKKENVTTGLLAGPEDCWQFSLLVFMCSQVARNINSDIRKLLDDFNKKRRDNDN